jgi:hypothetical protein
MWTGDAAADHGGWVTFADTAQTDWTLGTATPRPQADTVTGVVEWGNVRNFRVVIPNTVNVDDKISLVRGFVEAAGVYRIEIAEEGTDGNTYEFDVASAASSNFHVSPTIAYVKNQNIKTVVMLAPGPVGLLTFVVKNTALRGRAFAVRVTAAPDKLAPLTLHTVTNNSASVEAISSFRGDEDYPGADLTQQLKAMSGDAQATLPPGINIGQSASGQEFPIQKGVVTRLEGYWKLPAYVPGSETAFVVPRYGNKTLYAEGDIRNLTGMAMTAAGGYNKIGGGSANGHWLFEEGGPGFWRATFTNSASGKWFSTKVLIDMRDPALCFIKVESTYEYSNSTPATMWYQVEIDPAKPPTTIYFSGYTHNMAEWRVYKG